MASRSGEHGTRSETNDAIVSRLAKQDYLPWYKKPNLRLLYLLMIPTCLAVEMTNGFDASVLNGLQAVPSWLEYYGYPRSALLGLMSSMYNLGSILAIPFIPFITDEFGRRRSILVGSIIMLIGGVMQGAALNLPMFIAARFILGFGVAFAIVAASSLVGELSHPKERAILGSLFSAGYDVGAVSAAGVTLQTFAIPNNWAWRIPSFLQVIPCLLQISFMYFLPESPRWLVSKGRGEEAYTLLVRYHAEGDKNSEFAKAEYTQIEQTLEEELKNARMSWKEVLSTPGNRKRVTIASFLALFTRWSGSGLTSYFLSPVLDTIGIHDNRTKNIIHLVIRCWGLINSTLAALVAPRFPRRRIYLTCTVSLFIIIIAWTIASAEYEVTHSLISSQIVLVLIFLFGLAYNLGFHVLTYTYLVELFPFHIRARGITIFQWWSRGAGFVVHFVDPIGIDAMGWRYYTIYCVWIAFEIGFVYFMFPETSGKTLEELTCLFEGGSEGHDFRNSETMPLLREHREEENSVEN